MDNMRRFYDEDADEAVFELAAHGVRVLHPDRGALAFVDSEGDVWEQGYEETPEGWREVRVPVPHDPEDPVWSDAQSLAKSRCLTCFGKGFQAYDCPACGL